MAASPSIDQSGGILVLDEDARSLLLDIAEATVVAGLDGRPPDPPDLGLLPLVLREPSGVFVTLFVDGRLNGCAGSVVPREPISSGVAHAAWIAAFEDPRLPRLRRRDFDDLALEISVLSPISRMDVGSHDELVAALRPGIDGLYLTSDGRASVFLPAVWKKVSSADEFVCRLQLKAGWPAGWWAPDLTAYRFTVTEFGRAAGE